MFSETVEGRGNIKPGRDEARGGRKVLMSRVTVHLQYVRLSFLPLRVPEISLPPEQVSHISSCNILNKTITRTENKIGRGLRPGG